MCVQALSSGSLSHRDWNLNNSNLGHEGHDFIFYNT